MLAQWKAHRAGKVSPQAAAALGAVQEFEEIEVLSCAGTDTQVLDAEMLRAARDMRWMIRRSPLNLSLIHISEPTRPY